MASQKSRAEVNRLWWLPAALVAWCLSIGSARADKTALSFIPGCLAVVDIAQHEDDGYFEKAGAPAVERCVNAVSDLLSLNAFLAPEYKACPPKGTTVGTATIVIMKFLNDHLEKEGSSDFVQVGAAAIARAWPCHRVRS